MRITKLTKFGTFITSGVGIMKMEYVHKSFSYILFFKEKEPKQIWHNVNIFKWWVVDPLVFINLGFLIFMNYFILKKKLCGERMET